MHAHPLVSVAQPIAYADQKQRKVFVLSDDRSFLIPPSDVSLEDKSGNQVLVPMDIHGDMTVLDVAALKAGSYLLKIAGIASRAIRIVLF